VPILGHLGGRGHIVYGVGWSGNGVGPSVVGGPHPRLARARRATTSGAARRSSNRRHDHFPPSRCARWARRVVRARGRAQGARRGGPVTRPRGLDERLAALAPAGLEDKE
jgi:hypothetical protein